MAMSAVRTSAPWFRDAGIYGYERALARRDLTPVAGVDEAGRGACAGPLVVAAAVLKPGKRGEIPGLADSKLLTPLARERVYAQVLKRAAAYSVVVIPAAEIDRTGLHVSNVMGMRRALASLSIRPGYVLSDGFAVPGLEVPGLAVWKGDRVAACIAAASVLAKVTRDRMMVAMHDTWPEYEFASHKGYVTPEHQSALAAHGPCPEHRRSYVNVRNADVVLRAPDGDVVLRAPDGDVVLRAPDGDVVLRAPDGDVVLRLPSDIDLDQEEWVS